MNFTNTYSDRDYAEAYAKLEFRGTYYLAYRDLPKIMAEHVQGTSALDFGCGAGRSTRFLRRLGFQVVGIDISEGMIRTAREIDPTGDYRLVDEGDFTPVAASRFDLILSAFTFDNVPTHARKVELFNALRRLLAPAGGIVSLVSSPDIYVHEWVSFSTRDFLENQRASSGDTVSIIITDISDSRPVKDIVWTDESYRQVYEEAGLEVIDMYKPLAREDEPYQWVNEMKIAPWVIYVLKSIDTGTSS